jgi:hypothetical protein
MNDGSAVRGSTNICLCLCNSRHVTGTGDGIHLMVIGRTENYWTSVRIRLCSHPRCGLFGGGNAAVV